MFLLQDNPIGDVLNNTEWAFPAAECVHIVGFGIAVGTIMLVDFRLMGLALKQQAAAYVVKQTWICTLFALLAVIFSGMALFLSDPRMYERNSSFKVKITLLAIAILYHYAVIHKVAASGSSGGLAKMAALLSALMWIAIVFCGLFIAFV